MRAPEHFAPFFGPTDKPIAGNNSMHQEPMSSSTCRPSAATSGDDVVTDDCVTDDCVTDDCVTTSVTEIVTRAVTDEDTDREVAVVDLMQDLEECMQSVAVRECLLKMVRDIDKSYVRGGLLDGRLNVKHMSIDHLTQLKALVISVKRQYQGLLSSGSVS